MPALRSGAIKDFKNICDEEGVFYYGTKTPHVFTINKWTFEFYSVDKEAKGRGGRRDRLFINEANRMRWSIARQLIARSHVERIFDFNPVEKFWAHDNFVDTGEAGFVQLTYKDNEMLPQSEIDDIERHAPWGSVPDENYWRVFGEGKIGFVEGQIFKNYKKYKKIPKDCEYQEAIGVDWGDTDPMTAIHVKVDHKNKRAYYKQLFYASQASVESLAEAIKAQVENWEDVITLCDHEPKLIRMLRGDHDIPAIKANKKGTLPADIKLMKEYEMFIHEDSTEMIYEMDNYKYQQKDDLFIDYPDQKCAEHAIDAGRYGFKNCVR
jgi:phage terminase large subunit